MFENDFDWIFTLTKTCRKIWLNIEEQENVQLLHTISDLDIF